MYQPLMGLLFAVGVVVATRIQDYTFTVKEVKKGIQAESADAHPRSDRDRREVGVDRTNQKCHADKRRDAYGCEDWFFSPSLRRTSRDILREILPETEGIAVSLGLPVLHEGSLYNTSVLAIDGHIAGLVAKQHLAGDGLHYEPRWFKPWPSGRSEQISFDGTDVPFGDILFDLNGIRVGFEICEDAWVADRPALSLASRNVDIILNPSASHFAFGKSAIRRQLVAESSLAFNATYVYANMVGNEAGRAIYDGGALIASSGNILGSGSRFTYELHNICEAVIDVDATRTRRAQVATKTSNPQQQPTVVRGNYEWPTATAPSIPSTSPKWERSEYAKEEEFTRAVCLALFDYARKSHSKGFVVSLSGGADSTAVACLVRLMVDLGISDIGLNEFCRRMGACQSPERSSSKSTPIAGT